jgi:hypothetical protein
MKRAKRALRSLPVSQGQLRLNSRLAQIPFDGAQGKLSLRKKRWLGITIKG